MSGETAGWSTESVAGHPVDVFEPPGVEPCDVALLYLHDSSVAGQTADSLSGDPLLTEILCRLRLPAVCPRDEGSWWLDRLYRRFDQHLTALSFLRDHAVPWIQERWSVAPPHIGLLGVGSGGQGVLQLAYRWPRQFPAVAAISPAVDFHQLIGQGLPLDEMFADREAARQQTATLQIHPLNWPASQWFASDPADSLWFEGAERLASKLSSMGILHEVDLEATMQGRRDDYVKLMLPRGAAYLAAKLRALPVAG